MIYLIGIAVGSFLLLAHLYYTEADFGFILFCLGIIIFSYYKYNSNKRKINENDFKESEEERIRGIEKSNKLLEEEQRKKNNREYDRVWKTYYDSRRKLAQAAEQKRITKLKEKFKKLDEEDKKRQDRLNKKNKVSKTKVTKKIKKKKISSPAKKEEFYVAIDFETANNSGSSACEIGYALFTRKKIVESDSHLIQPPTQYFRSDFTEEIHHISWEDVEYEPTFDEVWDIVYKKIKDAKFIAAHNASFDKNVLKECCNYYSISFPRKKFVCTYRDISSKLWSFENNKLPTVCRHLRIPLDHHKGKSDAEACAKIVIKGFKEGWNNE